VHVIIIIKGRRENIVFYSRVMNGILLHMCAVISSISHLLRKQLFLTCRK
jgi:hypothetical protein